uniref:Pentatricopeptide repeat-containing protein n=1 Tax=Rhabditophanes sp. KR3021 TaxID=114890 RepID=A0AC35TJ76_9BILA
MSTHRVALTNVFRHGSRFIIPAGEQGQEEKDLQTHLLSLKPGQASSILSLCLNGNISPYKSLNDYSSRLYLNLNEDGQIFRRKPLNLFNSPATGEPLVIEGLGKLSIEHSTLKVDASTQCEEVVVEMIEEEDASVASNLHLAECTEEEKMVFFNFATSMFEGRGITEDKEKAISIWSVLSGSGHAPSQYHLAACMIRGLGLDKDTVQGFELMKKSADQEYADAVYYMTVHNIRSSDFDRQLCQKQVETLVQLDSSYQRKFEKFLQYKDFPAQARAIIEKVLKTEENHFNLSFQMLQSRFKIN